ncbi:hypothetical protein ZIOFF_065226 [Zingiber officinale]|uniref:DUF7876 domain-containing protein n=1 Tax=Zingiber officinale TaxID=94328 RepID=A0A8J5EZS3_ZINOF|nr:hypothetical protein ZIOFF_065226 [Zingiber officinale]
MEMKFLNHLMISCTYIFVVALQCHWDSNASSDQDYRSSRNIAISLFKRYRNVIDRGSGDNLKEFISAGVNAYALGCTDEGLRQELINIKDSGAEVEGLQTDYGGTTVKLEIVTKEVNECILWLGIVFITILCTPPPTVVRWSSTAPVSAETMHQWKGFCAIIANAYYVRGMAWYLVQCVTSEDSAAGTNGRDRQCRGTIARSKSDENSIQHIRGCQSSMAKSLTRQTFSSGFELFQGAIFKPFRMHLPLL